MTNATNARPTGPPARWSLVWSPHWRWTHAGECAYPDQDAAEVVGR